MTLHLLAYEKRGEALVSDVALPGLGVGEAREILHLPDHDAYPVTVEAAAWLARRAALELRLDDLDYFVEAHSQ